MECLTHSPAFNCSKMAWVAGLGPDAPHTRAGGSRAPVLDLAPLGQSCARAPETPVTANLHDTHVSGMRREPIAV